MVTDQIVCDLQETWSIEVLRRQVALILLVSRSILRHGVSEAEQPLRQATEDGLQLPSR